MMQDSKQKQKTSCSISSCSRTLRKHEECGTHFLEIACKKNRKWRRVCHTSGDRQYSNAKIAHEMQRTRSCPTLIGFAALAWISLVLSCGAQSLAKALVFDSERSGAASELGNEWHFKIHREPSRNAPLVKLPTANDSEYRYDLMRAITRNPGIVQVLRGLDINGTDSKNAPVSVHATRGEQFESSDSAMLLAHDGSDCIARIHGITFYPNCLWLSGFNLKLREGKFKFVQPSGKTEVWYRIVDSSGNVIGWRLQDWPFQAD